ncbi:Caleosin related protein-domain-containing protein [Hysterangium stoloniferum]|nr:Caleosin related protein-domain-containing protein [Hysterangium stoloniferum]
MAPPKDALSTAPLLDSKVAPTVLQTHAQFFDRNGDGLIYPRDTYSAMRDVGFNPVFALFAVLFIHMSFSMASNPNWTPDLSFKIRIDRLHRGVHGSDTRSISHEGEFDEARFEKIFSDYTPAPHDSISFKELRRMMSGNRNAYDFFGMAATLFEWGTAFLMVWPENGRLTKEEVMGIVDGSIFQKLADKQKAIKEKLQQKESKKLGKEGDGIDTD